MREWILCGERQRRDYSTEGEGPYSKPLSACGCQAEIMCLYVHGCVGYERHTTVHLQQTRHPFTPEHDTTHRRAHNNINIYTQLTTHRQTTKTYTHPRTRRQPANTGAHRTTHRQTDRQIHTSLDFKADSFQVSLSSSIVL